MEYCTAMEYVVLASCEKVLNLLFSVTTTGIQESQFMVMSTILGEAYNMLLLDRHHMGHQFVW